jgi:hypothetical protein
MKSVLPWAVVLAAIGVGIWWLLGREMTAGRWLLAGFVLAHGAVHLLFAIPRPDAAEGGLAWPFDMTRSWTITGAGLDPDLVRTLGWVLIGIMVASFALAALATVGIAVPAAWWQPSLLLAAVISALALVVFFDSQLVLGLGIDATLVWLAVAEVWVPA